MGTPLSINVLVVPNINRRAHARLPGIGRIVFDRSIDTAQPPRTLSDGLRAAYWNGQDQFCKLFSSPSFASGPEVCQNLS